MIVRSHGSGRPARVYHDPLNVESTSFTIRGDPAGHEAAAFSGGKPVGFMSYDEPREHLDSVYVSPQFRGHQAATRMYFAAGSPTPSPNLTVQGEGLTRSIAKNTGQEMPAKIHREEPLSEAGYQAMLPDFAGWIDQAATRTRRYTSIRRPQ